MSKEEVKKHSKVYLLLFVMLILVSIALTYYRTVVTHNFETVWSDEEI